MARPGVGLIAQADNVQQFVSPLNGGFAAELFMGDGRFNQIFQHRQMRKEIEILEDVADVDALAQDLFLFQLVEPVAFPTIANVLSVDLDKAFVYPLQMINRP